MNCVGKFIGSAYTSTSNYLKGVSLKGIKQKIQGVSQKIAQTGKKAWDAPRMTKLKWAGIILSTVGLGAAAYFGIKKFGNPLKGIFKPSVAENCKKTCKARGFWSRIFTGNKTCVENCVKKSIQK